MHAQDFASEWGALTRRIDGYLDILKLYVQARNPQGVDGASGGRALAFVLKEILLDVETFQQKYRTFHSSQTATRLRWPRSRHGMKLSNIIDGKDGKINWQPDQLIQISVELASFRHEFEYYFRDAEVALRSLTERGFQHLQRLIVADPREQHAWQQAFSAGETSCEKLGAAHLLWHGIFAFKAHAAGARTDLVFSEDVKDDDTSGSVGMVLTEWKVARGSAEVSAKCAEARVQSQDYSSGVLGGVELKSMRYIVVVSECQLEMPQDVQDEEVTYRHVNIAVTPHTPSKHAVGVTRANQKLR
jgi:hypothetical protein